MEHPFFESIDWDLLSKKGVTPPYIPKTKRIDDLRHIDSMFKDETVQDTPTKVELRFSEKERNHFKEFTYSKEAHISQNIDEDSDEQNDLSQVLEDEEFLTKSCKDDNDNVSN